MLLSGSNYYLMKLYNKLPSDVKGHSTRVSILMSIITEGYMELGFDPGGISFGESRGSPVQFARESGFYHDIGKASVPRELLMKHGALTPAELAEIRKHTLYAEKLLKPCIGRLGTTEQQYYSEVMNVCVTHHERWDGKGYPYGLGRSAIPVFSRICAVADTYDAMTSRRSYGSMATHQEAACEIGRCSGAQFDPDVVEAFMSRADEVKQLLSGRRAPQQ